MSGQAFGLKWVSSVCPGWLLSHRIATIAVRFAGIASSFALSIAISQAYICVGNNNQLGFQQFSWWVFTVSGQEVYWVYKWVLFVDTYYWAGAQFYQHDLTTIPLLA